MASIDVPAGVPELLKKLRLLTGLSNGQVLTQALEKLQEGFVAPKAAKPGKSRLSPGDPEISARRGLGAVRAASRGKQPRLRPSSAATPTAKQASFFDD